MHAYFSAHPDLYNWLVLPLIIFLCRVCDVSIGTLRGILLSKGFRKVVPLLGFIEVLIWIMVISQVMKNLNNWLCYVGWAAGFATGTVVGMKIEEKLALGLRVIRIITHENCESLIDHLKSVRRGVTIIDGKGAVGPVKMIFTVVKRKEVKEIEDVIAKYHPRAFYSVEDITTVRHGTFAAGGDNRYAFLKGLFSASH